MQIIKYLKHSPPSPSVNCLRVPMQQPKSLFSHMVTLKQKKHFPMSPLSLVRTTDANTLYAKKRKEKIGLRENCQRAALACQDAGPKRNRNSQIRLRGPSAVFPAPGALFLRHANRVNPTGRFPEEMLHPRRKENRKNTRILN